MQKLIIFFVFISFGVLAKDVEFNTEFLISKDQAAIDIERFNKDESAISTGEYPVNIYVNGVFNEKTNARFVVKKGNLVYCIDKNTLKKNRIKSSYYSSFNFDVDCIATDSLNEFFTWKFNSRELRLDLSIPQAMIDRSLETEPLLLTSGDNAGLINYMYNFYQSQNELDSNSDSYLGLRGQINLGGWRLFNQSSLQNKKWTSLRSYASHSVPSMKSKLTVGQNFTDGDTFDSVNYLGLNLSSDKKMYSINQRNFIPVIQGIARTQALVTIEQSGRLLHEETVQPGAFFISNYFPSGSSGDLTVTINESDGSKQRYAVPYTATPLMIKDGVTFFDATLGYAQKDNNSELLSFGQGVIKHGFSNLISGYAGVSALPDYYSLMAGIGLNTEWGAWSLISLGSDLSIDDFEKSGRSYKATYAYTISETKTRFSAAGYKMSDRGYIGLDDAVGIITTKHDQIADLPLISNVFLTKQQVGINVSQPLGENYGSLFLSWGKNTFWDDIGSKNNLQLSYSNNIKSLNYQLSAQHNSSVLNNIETKDTVYSLSLTMPFGGNGKTFIQSEITQNADGTMDAHGSVSGYMDELGYNVTAAKDAVSMGGNYNTDIARLSVNASKSKTGSQIGAGASGSLVFFEDGIKLNKDPGSSFAIVEAKDATGAKFQNYSNVKIGKDGFAIIPNLNPYSENTIMLSSGDMDQSVELVDSLVHVTPDESAIVRVNFKTKKGFDLIINAKQANGKSVPFGAEIQSDTGESIGVVGQGGLVYGKVSKEIGKVIVKWSDGHCYLKYNLKNNESNQNICQNTDDL